MDTIIKFCSSTTFFDKDVKSSINNFLAQKV